MVFPKEMAREIRGLSMSPVGMVREKEGKRGMHDMTVREVG